jgi:hypothetical protein
MNLFGLIVLGVVALLWISRFTGYLEVVIAALGFGGVLAWIPFLANMVSKDRKELLQGHLESVLKRRITTVILGVITAILLVVGWNVGCLVIDSRDDSMIRKLIVRKISDSQDRRDGVRLAADVRVSPGSVARLPLFTGWRGGSYEIDVEGLPLFREQVRPYSRVRLAVPADFLRHNAVLVRADPLQSQTSANPQMHHRATIVLDGNDANGVDVAFEGRSLWIACREEVAVPESLRQKWRLEVLSWLLERRSNLPSSNVEAIMSLWISPDAVEKIPVLVPGQKLTVKIHTEDSTETLAEGSGFVEQCRRKEDFPQVIYLRSVERQ